MPGTTATNSNLKVLLGRSSIDRHGALATNGISDVVVKFSVDRSSADRGCGSQGSQLDSTAIHGSMKESAAVRGQEINNKSSSQTTTIKVIGKKNRNRAEIDGFKDFP